MKEKRDISLCISLSREVGNSPTGKNSHEDQAEKKEPQKMVIYFLRIFRYTGDTNTQKNP
jgi:hypothetical protein